AFHLPSSSTRPCPDRDYRRPRSKACSASLEQARRKALADQAALPVTAVGVETVADHPLAVAQDVGDDRDKAGGHLAEIDIGVADGRRNRLGDFANVDDTDRHASRLVLEIRLDRAVNLDRQRIAVTIPGISGGD